MLAYQTEALIGQSRYQAVLELAQQGLDRSDIAAQTGLAQEAIRMLLAKEKRA
jgi:DNA-binding NarL/FixJ family response regulator